MLPICKYCRKEIPRKSGTFCNRSCSAYYNNKKRLPRSYESRLKTSISGKKAHLNPKFKEKWNRLYESRIKYYQTICRSCQKEFTSRKKYKIYCSKECLKKGHSDLRIRNPRNNWGKGGYYKGIRCLSSYELAFVIWAMDHQKNIKKCELQIDYEYGNRKRRYNPDFQIDDQIYEIKGWLDDRSKEKIKAASEKGIIINLIDKIRMKKYLQYVDEKYSCNIIKDYGKFYEMQP